MCVCVYIGPHWRRQWIVAWWHQAIVWASVDDMSSVKRSGIDLRAILQEKFQPSMTKFTLKIIKNL